MLEMVLALAIASLLFSVLMSIYLSGNKLFEELLADSNLQYSARSAIWSMEEDIRGASDLEILGGGSRIVLYTSTGETREYYLANGQVYRVVITNRGSAKYPIAENISNLCFQGDSNLVNISVQANIGSSNCLLLSNVHPRIYH